MPRGSRCRLPKLSSGDYRRFRRRMPDYAFASLLPFLLMLVKRRERAERDGRFEVEAGGRRKEKPRKQVSMTEGF